MKGLEFANEKFGTYKFGDERQLTHTFTLNRYNPEKLNGDQLIELQILRIAEEIARETMATLETGLEQATIKKRILAALRERAGEFFATPQPEAVPAEPPEVKNIVVEPDENHERVQENFGVHLRSRHQRLARLFSQHDCLREHQDSFPLLEKDDPLPNVPPNHYTGLQKTLGKKFQTTPAWSPKKRAFGEAISQLKAFILLHQAYLLLKNTTYRDGLDSIDLYQTDPKIHWKTRCAIFGVEHEDEIRHSQLNLSRQTLEDAILRNETDPERQPLVHPKVRTTQELIERLKGNGPILVVCPRRSTANYLNKLCRLQWNTNSAMIHGADTAPAKNRARHQFVAEQCQKGHLDIIFTTNVAAEDITLPGIAHVIVFSPLKNGEQEQNILSRIQKGGTMTTLGMESEQSKLSKNRRERTPIPPDEPPAAPTVERGITGRQIGLFGGQVLPIVRPRRRR